MAKIRGIYTRTIVVGEKDCANFGSTAVETKGKNDNRMGWKEVGRRAAPANGKSPEGRKVGMTGFEPATSSSRTTRATGLRYIPNAEAKIQRPPKFANLFFTLFPDGIV